MSQKNQPIIGPVERLLYSRAQTAHALGGISIATVIRHENAGRLDKSPASWIADWRGISSCRTGPQACGR